MIATKTLYEEMKEAFDYSPVLITMRRQDSSLSHEQATELFHAFLQWFSLIPRTTEDEPLQMLETVDKAWHAFILNTKLYRDFCSRFFGHYIHHNPLDPFDDQLPKDRYAKHTLLLLRQEFGENVNPALLRLEERVTCCIGCVDD